MEIVIIVLITTIVARCRRLLMFVTNSARRLGHGVDLVDELRIYTDDILFIL